MQNNKVRSRDHESFEAWFKSELKKAEAAPFDSELLAEILSTCPPLNLQKNDQSTEMWTHSPPIGKEML